MIARHGALRAPPPTIAAWLSHHRAAAGVPHRGSITTLIAVMSPSTRAPAHLESAERANVAEHAAEHESVLHLDIRRMTPCSPSSGLSVEDIPFGLASCGASRSPWACASWLPRRAPWSRRNRLPVQRSARAELDHRDTLLARPHPKLPRVAQILVAVVFEFRRAAPAALRGHCVVGAAGACSATLRIHSTSWRVAFYDHAECAGSRDAVRRTENPLATTARRRRLNPRRTRAEQGAGVAGAQCST